MAISGLSSGAASQYYAASPRSETARDARAPGSPGSPETPNGAGAPPTPDGRPGAVSADGRPGQAAAPAGSTDGKANGKPDAVSAPDAAGGTKKSGDAAPVKLSPEALEQVRKLQARDAEVRQHELAHLAAAGGLATSGASFTYQKGPDGVNYAVGGEVSIDTSPGGTPEETIARARTVQAAALAPADPSGPDRAIAAAAAQQEQNARIELLLKQREEATQGEEQSGVGQVGQAGQVGQVGQTGQPGQVGSVDQTEQPGQVGQAGQVGQVGQVGQAGQAGQARQVGQPGQTEQTAPDAQRKSAPPDRRSQVNSLYGAIAAARSPGQGVSVYA